MDNLRMAEDALRDAGNIRDADQWSGDRDAASLAKATMALAYATIVQAEQSKRIADALEGIASAAYGIDSRSELAESTAIWGIK